MTEARDIDGALDALGAEQAFLALADRIRALRPSPHDSPCLWHACHEAARATARAAAAGASRVAVRRLATLPDPDAHPHATGLALAAEAVATEARFWPMTRALPELRHDAPRDPRAAARRAGVDFDRLLALMRAGAAGVRAALQAGARG
jgi:hypothetical protein